jgi:hypothetical protein
LTATFTNVERHVGLCPKAEREKYFNISFNPVILISTKVWTHKIIEPTSGNVGFVVDKVALGQVFSEYFGFPCQFLFHRLLHIYHHLLSGAGTIGQLVADVPSGLSVTQLQETKKHRIFVSDT